MDVSSGSRKRPNQTLKYYTAHCSSLCGTSLRTDDGLRFIQGAGFSRRFHTDESIPDLDIIAQASAQDEVWSSN